MISQREYLKENGKLERGVMMLKTILIIFITLLIDFCYVAIGFSYDNIKTHPEITQRAAEVSNLKDYLNIMFALSDGLNKEYKRVMTIEHY